MDGQIETFFAPFRELWGVRHDVMGSAQLFFFALLRWIPIVQFAPFLGGRLVPAPVKIGLAMVMAWFTTPWLSHAVDVPLHLTPMQWWVAVVHEIGVGFLLGFASSLVFFAVSMGGQFLDNLRGTTLANILVPQLQVQVSLLADFYFQLFIVLYILIGGHRWFLSAVIESYRQFPPLGRFPQTLPVYESFLQMTTDMFGIMLKVVAPAVVVLILMDVILGVANRMAPQLNVFFMGFTVKPVVALLVIGLGLYTLLHVTDDIWRYFYHWMIEWIRAAR